MKLFEDFEAVRFPEENIILVTHNEYIYYIYNHRHKHWYKYRNAGNDHITVSNYQDISEDELKAVMNGIFPKKETDFMRLCRPSQLGIWNMMMLLEEDYPDYMDDQSINYTVHRFLLESDIAYKTFNALNVLLNEAIALQYDNRQVLIEVKELCLKIIGRDIFKDEIGIVDGHDSSSYFWIMPVRVIDDSDTNSLDNVAEMRSNEISIEENDVDQYLTPFLYKYFDDELKANKMRVKDYWIDDEGNEQTTPLTGFDWNLTYNFYTFDSIKEILKDIKNTIEALSSNSENEFTAKLREKRGFDTYELIYAKDLTEEQVKEYNDNRPTVDNTPNELVIDFYNRFIYRMEYMIRVGEEKGYNLISFMGP